jgi:uncharacterized protein (TIGR02611 family)
MTEERIGLGDDEHDLTRRARRWLDRSRDIYEDHGRVFRTLWVSIGVIIVLVGIAMIVFPGPVTIVVPLGLAMLAAAFGWARRLLMRSVEKGVEAKERVEEAGPLAKGLGLAASACVAAAVVAFLLFRYLV